MARQQPEKRSKNGPQYIPLSLQGPGESGIRLYQEKEIVFARRWDKDKDSGTPLDTAETVLDPHDRDLSPLGFALRNNTPTQILASVVFIGPLKRKSYFVLGLERPAREPICPTEENQWTPPPWAVELLNATSDVPTTAAGNKTIVAEMLKRLNDPTCRRASFTQLFDNVDKVTIWMIDEKK
jgi:hypothetical protein